MAVRTTMRSTESMTRGRQQILATEADLGLALQDDELEASEGWFLDAEDSEDDGECEVDDDHDGTDDVASDGLGEFEDERWSW